MLLTVLLFTLRCAVAQEDAGAEAAVFVASPTELARALEDGTPHVVVTEHLELDEIEATMVGEFVTRLVIPADVVSITVRFNVLPSRAAAGVHASAKCTRDRLNCSRRYAIPPTGAGRMQSATVAPDCVSLSPLANFGLGSVSRARLAARILYGLPTCIQL